MKANSTKAKNKQRSRNSNSNKKTTVKKGSSHDDNLNQTQIENEQIKQVVYEAYREHRQECLKQYNMAESSELENIYEQIKEEKEIHMLLSRVSVVILTANKYEKNILHSNLQQQSGESMKIKWMKITLFPNADDEYVKRGYFFCWHNYQVLHIEAAHTGSYTIGGSADIARYVLENPYINPTIMISFGICFGLNECRKDIGDVVISDRLYPYFIGAKATEEEYFVTDTNAFRVRNKIKSEIQENVIDVNQLNGMGFNAGFGSYLTGEAVVSDIKFREMIKGITKQKVVAGEMEGYGLFKECYRDSIIIPCMVIKSICDWGAQKNMDDAKLFKKVCGKETWFNPDEQKKVKDMIQAYASHNAFLVLNKLMEKHVFLCSPYERLKQSIKEDEHEHIIYWKSLYEKTLNISMEYYKGFRINKSRLDCMIKSMEEEDFLSGICDVKGDDSKKTEKQVKRKDMYWQINE